jgi:manganese transport protein
MAHWKEENPHRLSLAESHASIPIPTGTFWRKLLAFSGPGMMVAVGYMDPGNWATDLEGGAKFGYTLLSVILFSNFMAMLLQHLSLKLGIVTGRDLAQACRDAYSRPVAIGLWILCEIAITACDLAEVIGSAVAINLLFGIPLIGGILLTALDVMIILYLQHRGFRILELFVMTLIVIIGGCFAYEIIASRPDWTQLVIGLIPRAQVIRDPAMLYIAVGILGATVMPHNLYLHSSIVQTRAYPRNTDGRKMAVRFATIDSTLALLFAFFVNAAILVLSAAAFHGTQHAGVSDISDAYKLLSPVLGAPFASALFAIALLASGHNSTLTGTLAGQIVMEGFLDIRLRPWVRRVLTRLLAIVPAMFVAISYGEQGVGRLLIASQVVLSAQLAFAVVPLIQFTNDPHKMGEFKNGPLLKFISWLIAAIIIGLNVWMLMGIFARWGK